MTTRPPALGTFSVFDACHEGFLAVRRNADYLWHAGRLPLLVCLADAALVGFVFPPPARPVEGFLALLPTTVATAYMIFITARLCLLGEYAHDLPADRGLRADRLRLMQATVLLCVFFDVVVSLVEMTVTNILGPDFNATDPRAQGLALALAGVMFWALRFNPLPALTAVGYSIRRYVLAASGIWLSFLILALMVLCLEFPRLLLLGLAVTVTGENSAVPLVVAQGATFALKIWLFASYCAALQRMIREKPR